MTPLPYQLPEDYTDTAIDAAYACLDTPGKRGGRYSLNETRDYDLIGLDEVGVVIATARGVGIDLPEPANADLTDWLAAHFKRVSLVDQRPGDIAAFKEGHGINHVAVLTGEGTIIHAYERRFMRSNWTGVTAVTESRLAPIWVSRLDSIWRLKARPVASTGLSDEQKAAA